MDREQEAITFYDKVLAIDPTNRDALYNKANALYYLDKDEDAIVLYDKALAMDSNDTGALYSKRLNLTQILCHKVR